MMISKRFQLIIIKSHYWVLQDAIAAFVKNIMYRRRRRIKIPQSAFSALTPSISYQYNVDYNGNYNNEYQLGIYNYLLTLYST